MGKAELKLEIDAELLAKAQADGIDLAQVLETVLRRRLSDQSDADRARQWAEENADAIQAHRDRIEAVGVFGEDLRPW